MKTMERNMKRKLLPMFWLVASAAFAAPWPGFEKGMGVGGWLTNYKRFNVLPMERRLTLTPGDYVHFDTYIMEGDAA